MTDDHIRAKQRKQMGERAKHQTTAKRERGNEMRSAYGKMRKELKAGRIDPVALLRAEDADWEDIAKGLKLHRLLKAIPYIGETRTYEIITAFHASPAVRVRALSLARRHELAYLVEIALETTPARVRT